MKNKSWIDIGNWCIRGLLAIYIIASFVMAAFYIIRDKAPLYETEPVQVIKDWTYYDQFGEVIQFTSPYVVDRRNRDTFIYETKLPDSYPEGSVISFLNLSDMDVEVDGEIIYSWRRDEAPILGGPAKNSYFFIDLPTKYCGSTLRIIRLDNHMRKFLDAFIGERDAVVRTLELKSGLPNFIMSVILVASSLFVLLASLGLAAFYKKIIPLVSVATGIFISSCWCMFDSFVFQFVFRIKFLDGTMSYICTLGMIFGFIYYLDSLQGMRYQQLYFSVEVLEFINLVVFSILHFAKIWPFHEALRVINLIIVIGIIVIFAITIFDIVRKEAKNYQTCSIGFLLFMIFCLVEIILINVSKERVEGLFILIGLYVLLFFAVAQQVIDIRRVQRERDIATANALTKTQFLANMSHEIRTPINSILGMNEMIIRETTDPRIASYARVAKNSGEILLSLVNDILDFSKIDAGRYELVCAPYNPGKLINNICSIIGERAANKKLEAVYGICDDLPKYLYGDSKSISEILLNLLSNAVKYTNKGSISMRVTVKKEDDGKYNLNFRISDSGIGIKKEDINTIFDPFSRTDLKKNQSVQGTGLGLAITKQLVEQMGGTITLESKYGVGSTFFVSIPQRIPTEEEISNESFEDETVDDDKTEEDKFNAPNAKILVVDDTRANVIVVKAFLKRVGIVPDVASGGYEAVDMCCAKKYDLIFMDHMMPECDGIEAMHLIKDKSESCNADTPIVILTANAIKGSAEKYLAEGFDDYLSKPVNSDKLLKLVHHFLPDEKIE